MARPWAAVLVLAACLLALAPCACGADPLLVRRSASQSSAELHHGLDALQATMHMHTVVRSARELLQALNSSAGSDQNEMITLQGDIRIRPYDGLPFSPWLPLNGGNRTVLLVGDGAAASAAGAGEPSAPPPPPTVLDFGGTVNLLYHPVGHSFITYGLELSGLAPASSGLAAGLTSQARMVGGFLWPSTSGEPGHKMAFFNTTMRRVAPCCTRNETLFAVRALHQVLGRNDTVWPLGDHAYFVGQPVGGSYAVRVLPTGDTGGNIRWAFSNTTIICSQGSATSCVPPSPAQLAAPLAGRNASTAVAGSAAELLYLLAAPDVTRIVLGVHISLAGVAWDAFRLPIVLQGRRVLIESNNEHPKVLDLGGHPQLLYLSADSSMAFSRVLLQGAAPPSSVAASPSRTLMVAGSPLWPTIDGEAGHQLLYSNCTVQAYVTPCSRNATMITVVGEGGVVGVDDTSYAIVLPFTQAEPIRSTLTREQVGVAPYTFEQTTIKCQEDPGVALASQLAAQGLMPHSPHAATGGMPSWLPAAIAVPAAAALLAGITLVLLRRRQRRRRAASTSKLAHASPGSPRCSKMGRMESGELSAKLGPDEPSPPAGGGGAGEDGSSRGSRGSRASSSADRGAMRREQDVLWRARFGGSVVEGLELGELLGRGAYGKVYRGRWSGAIVAVKVIEHRISPGDPGALSREPLLCMSVSHPNCVCGFRLSVLRLLRGDGLLDPEDSATSLPMSPGGAPLSAPTSTGAVSATPPGSVTPAGGSPRASSPASGQQRRLSAEGSGGAVSESAAYVPESAAPPPGGSRRVRSLLSGAEAEVVQDPYGDLSPGLFESWIVTEYCDRGTLGEALSAGGLKLKDGSPNMPAILLCLLDVVSGAAYLHDLGIIHGDLKPANVLLKGTRNTLRGFVCKLADFGLSRMLDGRLTHIETGSLGTPTHAAPELLRQGRLSPAVDVFAFGILAWELTAGEEAWRGMHPMQIILQVTQQGARPPPLPQCPPTLAALMEACWADDPADRPTFAALMPQLQALLAEARQEQQARGQAARLGLATAHSPDTASGSLLSVRPAPSGALSPLALSPSPSTAALLPPPASPSGLSPAPSTAALLPPQLPSPPLSAEDETEAR